MLSNVEWNEGRAKYPKVLKTLTFNDYTNDLTCINTVGNHHKVPTDAKMQLLLQCYDEN